MRMAIEQTEGRVKDGDGRVRPFLANGILRETADGR
jgi:hypothetical protein